MSGIDTPFTAVQIYLRKRMWRLYLGLLALFALAMVGLALVIFGATALVKFSSNSTPAYPDAAAHFMYGSIGAESASGLPYWMWKALPSLYPADFQERNDYSAFGFIYQTDASGHQYDLPVGLSRRRVHGVDMVWFNCATCHTGAWQASADAPRHIVPGMPSNNLDLYRSIMFVLNMGADERIASGLLFPAMQRQGAHLSFADRLLWRYVVLPQVREGLIEHRSRLLPLLASQPAWGPGRVDTFNPYKLLLELPPGSQVPDAERVRTADFPAIFDQRPREGMQLHWDRDNNLPAEPNLSAALGAGVVPQTVDHAGIDRDADFLLHLRPPPSPYQPDPAAVARGQVVYMQSCASCHGWQGADGYVFQGAALGKVTPIANVGTDPNRLNSYTQAFRDWQISSLFAGTPYHFTHFVKTDGCANMPLDGLWLRAPYLHSGSVPNLADLLMPPAARPQAFLRGSDVIDPANGGFLASGCTPGAPIATGFCFDTSQRGNSAEGHAYGTDLPASQKSDLLAYLLTF